MADSSRHDTFFIAESTYGTTPASPSLTHLRHTSNTLALSKTGLQSEELYADTQERVFRHGNKQVGGEIGAELSYGTYDTLFESLMQSTFSTGATITAATISAADSDNSYNDSGSGFGSFSAGELVKVSGFTGDTSNNGSSVTTAATSAKLTVAGIDLADDAAGESVTITEYDTLKVGTTRKSLSIVRDFADITTGRYMVYTGMEVNSFTLNATPDAIVTGTFAFLGQGMTSGDSGPSGASYGSATTTDVFDSFSGTLQDNNSDIAVITAIDLTIERGLETKFVIGSAETLEPGRGRCMVTGNATVYFEDNALLNKFINETSSSINFSFVDAASNEFRFYLPNIKYNGGQPDVTGQSSVTLQMPFKALYDTTSATTMSIGKHGA